WRMYEHSVAEGQADGSWLLVPPVLASSSDSAPVEEVLLVRDPAADLCWGIERIVTNAVGRPVRRSEDLTAQSRDSAPDPREGLPFRRIRRRARGAGGNSTRWWSRQTTVGHGEASSGLAYDGLHATSHDPHSLGQ